MSKLKLKSKPVEIIRINSHSVHPDYLKYELLLHDLKRILEPIKNTEVCVFGIIGTTRRGKSFLLNYMLRYLSNPENGEWLGDKQEPLEGFQWLSSKNPQTFGIWFSKPFILKQSNGKEIAVILMDTQGLFDDTYQPRDWSTIVGISLMVSSFLIVNLFTDISEDMLSFFNTYIDYGIEAKESNKSKDSEDNCPFQNLLFLIRDWNIPNEFGFGIKGGKEYLDEKMKVRSNQSPESQKVRKNIKNCFQSIECFLMPQINSDTMEDKDFNGSVGQLRERFIIKMEELITRILNPEELVPKMIFGTRITGEELGHQIQSVVEVFNKKELPDSHNILEANTKLSDNILIRKLRDLHLEQMQRFIESKSFINRKQLEEQNRIYKTNCIEDFESSMKSRNSELTDKLIDLLNINYQIVYKENENRRDNWSKQAVEVCSQGFMEVISAVHKDNKFVQPEALEDLFTIHSKKFIELFREGFEAEDEKLFESQLFELTKFMYNYEKATRIANQKRINEFDDSFEIFVDEIVEFFVKNMEKALGANTYLTKIQFKTVEENVRTKTMNKLKSFNIDFGNPIKNLAFKEKVSKKLTDSKKIFKKKNENKFECVLENNENIVKKSIEAYKQEICDIFDMINSVESLEKIHEKAKNKSIEILNTCPFKDPIFFHSYEENFQSEINEIFSGFKINLIEKIDEQKRIYKTAMDESLDLYKKGLSDSIASIQKLEELIEVSKTLRKTTLKKYQSYFKEEQFQNPFFFEYKSKLKNEIKVEYDRCESDFQKDEKQFDLVVNKSIDIFNTKVTDILNDSSSYAELLANFNEIKENLKKNLRFFNTTIIDKTVIDRGIKKFEDIINQEFPKIEVKIQNKKWNILRQYNSIVRKTVMDYKQEMEKIQAENEYITEEEFKKFHETVLTQITSGLNSRFEPAFDFNINSFIVNCRQLIDIEYHNFVSVNKINNESKISQIKSLSKRNIDQYLKEINNYFKIMESVDEFQKKHQNILEDILEEAKKSKEFSNEILITIRNEFIQNEVSKLYEDILKKFSERIKNFEDRYQFLVNHSKDYHFKVMDSHFYENKFYTNEEFNTFLSESRIKTVEHFLKQLEEQELTALQKIKSNFLDHLNAFIDQSNINFKLKNDENRLLFDETLNEKAEQIKDKYKQTMAYVMGTVLSEEELNEKHYELMAKLLEEFNESVKIFDKTLLVPNQQRLQKFMSDELASNREEIILKIENILEMYDNVSKLFIDKYIENMNVIVKSNDLHTDDEFQDLHKEFSEEYINLFEKHLEQNRCSETQKHFIQFKQKIDDEYKQVNEIFLQKQKTRRNDLHLIIQDLDKSYIKSMIESQKLCKTEKELDIYHNQIKEYLKNVFKERCFLKDSKQIECYIEKLEENYETNREDFEYLLKNRIEKDTILSKKLKLDVRRNYREEMETYLKNKIFVGKMLFLKNHKIILKNTIDKYSTDNGNLSQDEFVKFVTDSISDIFIKFKEDISLQRPQNSPAIGIDLGTTNSCVAYFDTKIRTNNIIVISNELGHNTTPSVVSFRDNNITIIGDVAKDDIHAHPKNTISSAKRLIGRQFIDQSVQSHIDLWSYKVIENQNHNPMISVKVDGIEKNYKPEDISAQVLIKMKSIAETHLGCPVSKAVITVPAYFNDAQKEATKHAGRLAGLEVLRIINEPTAAAIAFKMDRNKDEEIRKVLIYDLGGGTFDVSIIEVTKGVIEVLAVGGDNNLGGDDFDTKLIQYCLQQFKDQYNLELQGEQGEAAMSRLRNKCEEHKKRLSSVESTLLIIPNFLEKHDLRVEITRDIFEKLNNYLFVKSINLVKTTLEDKHILPSDIDDIVLVGGSTRIPKIQELLSQQFGGRPLNHSVNPDEAVAKGAAIQAALLNGRQSHGLEDLELRDVTPLSLGIRIKGGKLSVIIPRNTPVPREYTKQYYTSEDMQTVVGIKIFEGEKEMANDNHLLGQFDLTGIPAAPRGDQPIDVTFKLNDEGILHVKAKVVSTGSEEQIEITEHKYGWDGPQQN